MNDTGTFFCRVERDTSNVTFEWSLKMNDGSEIRVYPNPSMVVNVYKLLCFVF